MPKPHCVKFVIAGLILIASLACSSSSGPDNTPHSISYGNMSGTVFLEGTSEPLTDVEVTVADRSDTTGNDGTYEIDSIPEGNHRLRALHPDYEPHEESVRVTGNTVWDIELTIAIEGGTLRGRVLHPFYGPVSSARISIGDLFTYSDNRGFYELPNVPVGHQVLSCTHPGGFHDRTDSLYITGADNQFDIVLIRTVENSVRTGQDATVRMLASDPTYATDSTSGRWRTLTAFHEYVNPGFSKSRIFVELPRLPPEVTVSQLEAATLKMYVTSTISAVSSDELWVPATLIARRVLSPWFEESVTWLTAPDVGTGSEAVIDTAKPEQSGWFEMDVLSMYLDDEGPGHGIRLALQSDERNDLRTKRVEIYSGNALNEALAPVVTFRYTH